MENPSPTSGRVAERKLGRVGPPHAARIASEEKQDPNPALPEAGEFSGMRFPEMEVGSWKWISC
jgi:hypothetical protein